MQRAQEVLQETARHRGSKVAPCQDFDPNVCTFTQDPRNRAALIASSGQPFLFKTAFKIGNLRIRLVANDTFLRIMALFDLDLEPISLNRTGRVRYSCLKEAGLFAVDAMEFQSILVWKLLKGRTLAG